MKTDFEKVTEKLKEVGAVLVSHTTVDDSKEDFYSPMIVNFWNVNQKGLIVCGYENGSCGLYSFVGVDNAPVDYDLQFIEEYAAQPPEEFEGGCPTCNEIVCFLHCQYCGDGDCGSDHK